MKTARLPMPFRLLLAALCLSFTFQSCSKEDSSLDPQPASLSSNSVMAPPACKTVCLVAGQHMNAGTVDVALDANFLYVTYNITQPNVYLLETHLDIFTSLQQLRAAKKLSNGGAIPGKFAYKMTFDAASKRTSYTAAIPRQAVDALRADCFYIASHAALSNGETAWGGICNDRPAGGVTLNNADQFPGNNWGVFFEFCKDACTGPVDFTYAWEDLRNTGNDGDYNDLVIKSTVTKGSTSMQIRFQAAARGAGFDHQFKFRIPKAGITNIFGADFVEDGNDYVVTVFSSTKQALPASGGSGFANTLQNEPCVNADVKTVTLAINNTFSYNPAIPYIPFISVFADTRTAGVGPFYDLYIYEVSNRDQWTDGNGVTYPNGILIPSDWKWPLEYTLIKLAYPNFPAAGWSANLADASKVFSNSCN